MEEEISMNRLRGSILEHAIIKSYHTIVDAFLTEDVKKMQHFLDRVENQVVGGAVLLYATRKLCNSQMLLTSDDIFYYLKFRATIALCSFLREKKIDERPALELINIFHVLEIARKIQDTEDGTRAMVLVNAYFPIWCPEVEEDLKKKFCVAAPNTVEALKCAVEYYRGYFINAIGVLDWFIQNEYPVVVASCQERLVSTCDLLCMNLKKGMQSSGINQILKDSYHDSVDRDIVLIRHYLLNDDTEENVMRLLRNITTPEKEKFQLKTIREAGDDSDIEEELERMTATAPSLISTGGQTSTGGVN